MNDVQKNYLEAKKNYLEASSLAWELVEAVLEEKGIDYCDESKTDEITKIEIACEKQFQIAEKKEASVTAWNDLRAWGIAVIEKQDVPDTQKNIAIDLLKNDRLFPRALNKLEESLLKLDGAA